MIPSRSARLFVSLACAALLACSQSGCGSSDWVIRHGKFADIVQNFNWRRVRAKRIEVVNPETYGYFPTQWRPWPCESCGGGEAETEAAPEFGPQLGPPLESPPAAPRGGAATPELAPPPLDLISSGARQYAPSFAALSGSR